jgi:hypothetical protein
MDANACPLSYSFFLLFITIRFISFSFLSANIVYVYSFRFHRIASYCIVSDSMPSSGEHLIDAAMGGDVAAMSAIAAEEGANFANIVNYRDRYGRTALMWAAWNNHPAALRWLIARNADLNATNDDGFTAAIMAAWNGHVEVLQLLVDAGADLAIRNDDGQTALTIAQQYNKADCVRIIKR